MGPYLYADVAYWHPPAVWSVRSKGWNGSKPLAFLQNTLDSEQSKSLSSMVLADYSTTIGQLQVMTGSATSAKPQLAQSSDLQRDPAALWTMPAHQLLLAKSQATLLTLGNILLYSWWLYPAPLFFSSLSNIYPSSLAPLVLRCQESGSYFPSNSSCIAHGLDYISHVQHSKSQIQ